jgi:ribosomal protein S18 acetylase RimI-like enzyme
MIESVQVRPFQQPEDFEAVTDLWDQSGSGVHLGRSDTFDEISKKLVRDPELFLVAEYMGEIIGAVIGGFDGRRGLVYHLAVSEMHRGQGIGKQLMSRLEDILREKGCLRSYLLITKDNPALEFYEKLNWQLLDLYVLGKDLQ